MPAGEMVDAALAGLDQGEFGNPCRRCQILLTGKPMERAPARPLFPNLSRSSAAYRYRVAGQGAE